MGVVRLLRAQYVICTVLPYTSVVEMCMVMGTIGIPWDSEGMGVTVTISWEWEW